MVMVNCFINIIYIFCFFNFYIVGYVEFSNVEVDNNFIKSVSCFMYDFRKISNR